MFEQRLHRAAIVRIAVIVISGFLTVVVIGSLIGWHGPKAHAANFTWSLGDDTSFTQFNSVDMDPGILKDGADLWVIYAASGGAIQRFKGPDMDHLVQQSGGTYDTSFNHPNGDDKYWLSGLWSDGTTWYATVHTEFHYLPKTFDYFRRISLATSTDQGLTWHNQGDIITSDNSYNQSDYPGYPNSYYIHFGDGDQKLYVDTASGYFYLYYMMAWTNTDTGYRYQSMRVARCPISAKMAPGCWHKWYNNTWDSDARGGHDSDIFPNTDNAVVFFDTYLQKYVAIGNGTTGFIATATNLATQNWTPRETFAPGRMQWYNWPLDFATGDRMTLGQSFRLYSASSNVAGNTKYMTVTFGSGSTTSTTLTQTFPPISVTDPNPGWQRNYPNGTYTNVYTNPFDNGLTNWQTVFQQGTSGWSQSGDLLTGTTTNDSELWGIDTGAPAVADGDLSFIVNPQTGNRFGAVFRYVSSSDYAMIYYDNGTFGYQTAGTYSPLFTLSLPQGTWHFIEIGFTGTSLTITVDGLQQYHNSIAALPTHSGQYGFRTWYFSTTQFDTVVLAYNDAPGNLVANPGFETGSLASWSPYGSTGVVSSPVHTGLSAAKLGANSGQQGIEQVLTGLLPNHTYTLTGWAAVDLTSEVVYIGVKNFDDANTEVNQGSSTTSFTKLTVPFTTGPNSTSARIYLYKGSGSGNGYGDDLSVVP